MGLSFFASIALAMPVGAVMGSRSPPVVSRSLSPIASLVREITLPYEPAYITVDLSQSWELAPGRLVVALNSLVNTLF